LFILQIASYPLWANIVNAVLSPNAINAYIQLCMFNDRIKLSLFGWAITQVNGSSVLVLVPVSVALSD
jgi:hypothetical protein